MAHFCELDDNNIVLRTIVVDNSKLLDENNNEQENLGIEHCKKLYGQNTTWKQTSYNSNFRKKYANKGMEYIPSEDIFIIGKPHNSWVLVEDYVTANFEYKAPVDKPTEPGTWVWNEGSLEWVLLN